jgi:7-cyano-7-deazaguanine reductase
MGKDPFFLDRDQVSERPQFEALGHSGSTHYSGLETFPNPGCGIVQYTSDEVMAKCPVTGQPDFYTVSIQLRDTDSLIESKSLKLYFQSLMMASFKVEGAEGGVFCESLAVMLQKSIAEAIEADPLNVTVQLDQKSRGGISIRAIV